MLLKEILSDYEEKELKNILDNKALLNGLKKIFLNSLYYQGVIGKDDIVEPRRNFICQYLYNDDMSIEYNLDDERLGQKTRASVEGIRAIEQGFRQLEELRDKKPAVEIDVSNPAR